MPGVKINYHNLGTPVMVRQGVYKGQVGQHVGDSKENPVRYCILMKDKTKLLLSKDEFEKVK